MLKYAFHNEKTRNIEKTKILMLPLPQNIQSQKIQERGKVKAFLHLVSHPDFVPLDHNLPMFWPGFYVGSISKHTMESKQLAETSLFANQSQHMNLLTEILVTVVTNMGCISEYFSYLL